MPILGNETCEGHLYRNSPDKRVKHSADQLYDAIILLMTRKTFDEIGIKEVCEKAGIGRATFYRNFDYVDDVLKMKLDQAFNELASHHSPEQIAQTLDLTPFFDFWVRHAHILETLLKANRWDFFSQRFDEVSNLKLMEVAQESGVTGRDISYLQNAINGLFKSVLQTWLSNGQKENAIELNTMFRLPFVIYEKRVDPKTA